MSRILVLFFVLGIVTACSQQDPTAEAVDAYTVIEEAQLNVGDDIPVPSGDVVLTITGAISNTNVDDTLQFDMETLEQLTLIEYSVDDYQAEGEVATFRGVLLSDVLALAGVDDDATILNTIALNDYAVEIPMEDMNTYPVMIATMVEGERMTVERYGPTRIVYPNQTFDIDGTVYDQRWIWQLATIEVR